MSSRRNAVVSSYCIISTYINKGYTTVVTNQMTSAKRKNKHPSSKKYRIKKGFETMKDWISFIHHICIITLTMINTTTSLNINDKSSHYKSIHNQRLKSFDKRKTISHSEAKSIYNQFAQSGHIGGNDASSNYGGPAIQALMNMADFGVMMDVKPGNTNSDLIQRILDYGCGQGKLAEHVFQSLPNEAQTIDWHGVDQSPLMIEKFQKRMNRYENDQFHSTSHFMRDGNPWSLISILPGKQYDRFVSTYCLDLLSEEDMYSVLALAEHCLHPTKGILLLAGITYGYKDSFSTFWMTLAWELMYRIRPDIVGGCRPQCLLPYLKEKGWIIETIERTNPIGFPWMMSEVISARPPIQTNQ